MAEKYELDRWAAVVCNGFTAVNVMSSGNVEELGWDYTEMELDPTGTCGLFDGMLLDWDDDTPAERRDHEAYFPDAFTVGARILADDWDHELGNDEVRSRCFAIIEDADQFTDHDTARDWLCESTMADFSEVEARTFFQNLTLMDSEEIAKLDGRPIIPSAGADECRAAVLAFNERMVPRRRELGLSAGLVANDAESIKALIGNCPAWIECFPSYSEKAAKGVDDAVQAVKAYRLEGKRVHREVIPGYLYETAKAAAAKTAGGADGGTGPHI